MPEPTSDILLVEDEAGHAELVRRAFAAENNYRLTIAGSLEEARAALRYSQPAIIIADLLLPDGRGTELLPPGDETPACPLVVLTSHGSEEVAVEAMKGGAVDYVVKSAAVLSDMPRFAERALREWRLINERKRAEEERQKLETRLQHSQKLESLGIPAGGIAHDFNNLLMAIMGHAKLAMIDLDDPAAARECIEDIESAAVHASELCRQLLDYSGRHRFVVEAIDLNSLVSSLTHLLEAAVAKRARLELETADELPAIEGAGTQIRQIVMNLIMNASDALGGENGTVTVHTGEVDADADYLAEAYLSEDLPPGPYVYVEVSDTGCGMSKDTQERLFDPFFTTKSTGRGLGMAAVKGIVRSHKGAIKLVSQTGRGTTFRILFPASDKPLPVVEAPVVVPDASASALPQPAGAATILVVDDDITIRAVTTIALEGAGYLVETAEDGNEAITKFKQHKDELAAVLLDINMPGLSGDEAFAQLRQLDASVPVIVTSGASEADATDLIPGLAAFVPKPYKAEALIAKVRQVLQ